jgi:hypothetical protein
MTIRQVKEIGLPAALELPQMEKRLALLQDQVEAAELQEALRTGSAQEQFGVYVIPGELDLDRLLATFDILADDLHAIGALSALSPIHVGEPQTIREGSALRAVPVTFDAELNREGMDKLLLLLRLSGRLTVSDALSPQQLSALINLTEKENPAALTVLEQFLGADLLRYSREPEPFENQVLRSLTSPEFEKQFTDIVDHSGLAKARYLFGGALGQSLEGHNLWPMPILTVERTDMQVLPGGMYKVALRLHAYVRPKK